MKRIALALALFGAASGAFLAAAPQVIEEIVAVVNDDIITLTQYKQQYEALYQQLKSQNMPEDQFNAQYKMLKDQLLDTMITDMLLLQQAKEKSINVAEELKSNLQKIKQENNFTTDEELRRAVESQGIAYDAWIKQYEDSLLKYRVIGQEVYQSIAVDDSEVVQYYKAHPKEFTVPTEYKLRAVYLSTTDTTPAALEARRAEISDKLKAGMTFEDAAAQFSDAPLKEAKGELGTLKQGEIDPTLEQAVDKLKAGEVSAWVQAKTGWYLLKVEERKDSYLKTFEDSREDVLNRLRNEKNQKATEDYLAKLKARSYIKILNPNPLGF
jgi:peptidyl-prolyl cis-trans isomerase SurA